MNDQLLDPRPASSHERTISRDVAISGVGIHTGKPIHVRLLPAPPESGVVFRRADSGGVEIPALGTAVSSVELATTLACDDVTISTVEHLLAAVRAAEIDNLVIELDGPEIPILDGSALPFVHLLEAAGSELQAEPRRVLALTAPVEVSLGARRIRATPYPGMRLTYAIDFAHPAIGHQEIDLVVDRDSFRRELAPARTFALAGDVERMRSRGLGRGGAVDNCVIFGDDGPVNTRLRFADEPVRHKALDAVGDLALLGAPLWAHVEVERGGHQLHYALVEALRRHPRCWTWMEAATAPEATRIHQAAYAAAAS